MSEPATEEQAAYGVYVDVCDRCGVLVDRVHERGSICWDLFLEMYGRVV